MISLFTWARALVTKICDAFYSEAFRLSTEVREDISVVTVEQQKREIKQRDVFFLLEFQRIIAQVIAISHAVKKGKNQSESELLRKQKNGNEQWLKYVEGSIEQFIVIAPCVVLCNRMSNSDNFSSSVVINTNFYELPTAIW